MPLKFKMLNQGKNKMMRIILGQFYPLICPPPIDSNASK